MLQVLGNVWLSRGMRQVGEVNTLKPLVLLALALRMLMNPWFMLGLLLLIAFFLLFLAALSRLELSYVLPMTASNYVLTALFAWLVLNENISPVRWAGTLAISVGVLLVALSKQNTDMSSTARRHIQSRRK